MATPEENEGEVGIMVALKNLPLTELVKYWPFFLENITDHAGEAISYHITVCALFKS